MLGCRNRHAVMQENGYWERKGEGALQESSLLGALVDPILVGALVDP